MTALEILDDGIDGLEPPEGSPLDEILEWRLHRIARTRSRLAELAGERDRMIDRYRSWHDRLAVPLLARLDADSDTVRALMLERVDTDPKASKTLHLPSGTVATRKGSTVVEVDDEAAFVAWATGNAPFWLRFPPPPDPKPDKVALKEAVGIETQLVPSGDGQRFVMSGTGEQVPGVRLVEKERTVTITTDLDEGGER